MCYSFRVTKAVVAIAVLLSLTTCAAKPLPETSTYRPTATVKDIMDSIVDPSADFLWNSVGTVIDAEGEHERFPQTEEEWVESRRRAIALVEATNLLLIPGRHIARPGEKPDDPKIELSPEAIEALVNQDWDTWVQRSHGLHDAVASALRAIDSRDPKALMDAGEIIDQACENCHRKYWYPNELTGLKQN